MNDPKHSLRNSPPKYRRGIRGDVSISVKKLSDSIFVKYQCQVWEIRAPLMFFSVFDQNTIRFYCLTPALTYFKWLISSTDFRPLAERSCKNEKKLCLMLNISFYTVCIQFYTAIKIYQLDEELSTVKFLSNLKLTLLSWRIPLCHFHCAWDIFPF